MTRCDCGAFLSMKDLHRVREYCKHCGQLWINVNEHMRRFIKKLKNK